MVDTSLNTEPDPEPDIRKSSHIQKQDPEKKLGIATSATHCPVDQVGKRGDDVDHDRIEITPSHQKGREAVASSKEAVTGDKSNGLITPSAVVEKPFQGRVAINENMAIPFRPGSGHQTDPEEDHPPQITWGQSFKVSISLPRSTTNSRTLRHPLHSHMKLIKNRTPSDQSLT